VKQLAAGRPPRSEILASLLLLQSSYFLLRNPKFRNNDSPERFDVYKLAVEGFWREVLMAGHVPEQMEEAPKQLLKTWSCHLLRAQTESWITSDNPVLLLTLGETTPALIFLPITPTWAVLALRTGAAKLSSSKITAQDTEYLNSYTAINSIRHVYSKSSFDNTEYQELQGIKEQIIALMAQADIIAQRLREREQQPNAANKMAMRNKAAQHPLP
jgi:hypothetical protein